MGIGSKTTGGVEELVVDLERREAIPPEAVAVLLVGSQVNGWANPSSDFDLVVVCGALPRHAGIRWATVALDPPRMGTLEVPGEPRAECAYWTDGQFDHMLAKVSWERFEARDTSLLSLNDAEETLLGRLVTAQPVRGDAWLARRREELRGSAYRTFVATRSLSEADGKIEDISGMIAAGDVESAVLAAQLAFGHTVDALLDSVEVYGSRTPKWRARRMLQAEPDCLSFETYWSVVTMRDYSPEDPTQWVHQVADLCRSLALDIDL